MIIDNFLNAKLISLAGTHWSCVTDQVMGGLSEASITHEWIDNRAAMRLRGEVTLENNGGFIQAAVNLAIDSPGFVDVRKYEGVKLTLQGNGEKYGIHLRTKDNVKPWQSYRCSFVTDSNWKDIRLPFSSFVAHRLQTHLDLSHLRRISLVALGRNFTADLSVCHLSLYKQ